MSKQDYVLDQSYHTLDEPCSAPGRQVEHKVAYCNMCGPMIRCGTCGNNCCNGGYGSLPDGTKCTDCPSAYDEQEKMWALSE